jgi:hypothetical protein
MAYQVTEVGLHPKYGPIFRRGEGIGSSYFVIIEAGNGIEGGEYRLCFRCKDPIIRELGHRIYIPMYDACAHYECVLRERLKFGPVKPYRQEVTRTSNRPTGQLD